MRQYPKTGKLTLLSDESFRKIVADSNSALEVMRLIGFKSTSGGTQALIAKRIKDLNVDTTHFTFNRRTLPVKGYPRWRMSEILVENSPYISRSRLKLRLVSEGIMEYKCALCGNEGLWNGLSLSLQLDHKNGVYNDHRRENIRFLCPNCHSQTETYSGKNRKKDKKENISEIIP